MLQGRPHDHISEGDHPDLLLMVTGSPQGLTLQLTQYRRLRQQTMGTKDEHRGIPIEDREVSEDLREGTHPREPLPAACKHRLMDLVGDVEVLIFSGSVLKGRPAAGSRDEKNPGAILITLIGFMQLFTTTRRNISPPYWNPMVK